MGRVFKIGIKSGVSAVAMAAAMAAGAYAQDDEDDDTVVVTGTRGQPRAVQDSPVPIDVIGEQELEDISFTDTNDVLKTLVPSYSIARQPISDGATFIRPASMRGLPTDKTLVLVNSKRRHRAALVSIGGSGTQGPDVATIPASALARVEVLRDGAAAQYGSDAIAGVINFILKEDPEDTYISAQVGQYFEGDGEDVVVTAAKGLALGPDGFVHLSLEYSATQETIRANQYCEQFGVSHAGGNNACVTDGINGAGGLFGPDYMNNETGYPVPDGLPDYTDQRYANNVPQISLSDGDVAQPWGQPNAEGFRSFLNAGLPVGESAELYAFANYSHSTSDGGFFHRYAGNGTIEWLREPDGSLYIPLYKFPAGFTPRFFGEVIDYSGTAGISGEFMGGLTYDLFARYGRNEIQYTLKNTINPSLGAASPTDFHPGDLISDEMGIGADFTYDFDIGGFASPLVFAFGGEYREEGYELVEGDPASFEAGPYASQDPWGFCDAGAPTAAGMAVMANGSNLDCSNDDDPVYNTVGVGSNGFPGYAGEFVGDFSRSSYGLYVDASADITDSLFLQAAFRFEDYEDFGTTENYKVAARYEFSPMFAIRGSTSTGFRAPTPGQLFTTNVSTRLPNGFPVATGLFPAGSAVAQVLGAEPLKPEQSTNYAIGFTSNPFDAMTITVDFYRIELEDRFNATSTFTIVNDIDDPSATCADGDSFCALASTLAAAGVANANTIGGANFFQNAFDTVTEGVDIVVTYGTDWGGSPVDTRFTGSLNYNTTDFDSDVGSFFNAETQYDFIHGEPEWRGVLTAVSSYGPFEFMQRLNYYGPYDNSDGGGATGNIQDFGSEIMVDLEATWHIDEVFSVALGARNAFDNYPDIADPAIGDSCCGRIYLSSSIVDWQGGFYYGKVTADF